MKGVRWGALLLIALLAATFAYLNGGERTTVNLGVAAFYRVPLSWLIFTAFVLGMVTMFLAGLGYDLRVRRALREMERGEPARGEPLVREPPPAEAPPGGAPPVEAPRDELREDPEPPPPYPWSA